MDIRLAKKWLLLSVTFILMGCPDDCTFVNRSTKIENLAKIEPVQEIYHLGDTLIYSVAIPSHIENFNGTGDTVNIFQETGIAETLYGGFEVYKLDGNILEVLEGRLGTIQETTVAYVLYYPETNDYRFMARVVFNQTGNYSLGALNDNRVGFNSGDEFCTEYVIRTSTQGIDPMGEFNFTVEE